MKEKSHLILFIGIILSLTIFYAHLPASPFVRDNGDKYLVALGLKLGLSPGELPFKSLIENSTRWNPFSFPFSYERGDKVISQYLPFYSVLAWPFESSLGFNSGIFISLLSGICLLSLVCFCFKPDKTAFYVCLSSPVVFYFFTFWEVSLALMILTLIKVYERKPLGYILPAVMGLLLLREDLLIWVIPYILFFRFSAKNLSVFLLYGIGMVCTIAFLYPEYINHFMVQGFLTSGMSKPMERLQVAINLLGGHATFHLLVVCAAITSVLLSNIWRRWLLVGLILILISGCRHVYDLLFHTSVDRYLLENNGLLLSFPVSVFLLHKDFYQNRRQMIFYGVVMGLYIVLCPFHTSYGVHFGPRILIGLVMWIILDRGQYSVRKNPLWILLICMGIMIQLAGLKLLYEKKLQTVGLMHRIEAIPSKVIVTDSELLASDVAPLYKKGYQVYLFRDVSEFNALIAHLRVLSEKNVILALRGEEDFDTKKTERFSMFKVDVEHFAIA